MAKLNYKEVDERVRQLVEYLSHELADLVHCDVCSYEREAVVYVKDCPVGPRVCAVCLRNAGHEVLQLRIDRAKLVQSAAKLSQMR